MKSKALNSKLQIKRTQNNWGIPEEVTTFAEIEKLYRQKKISEDEFRRFRLQNGAYGSRMQADYSMVRVKVPSGIITSEQLKKFAFLSDAFSIGSAHVSTRQNIQLHWVHLDDVSEVMRGLVDVGLTSREACGNTIRNVICSHFAGVCINEAFDATPHANAIAKFFLRNPLNQNLPRKFKFNFACCEDHSNLVRIADIGLVPAVKEINGQLITGFRIYLGGGLGPASFIGELLEEFTPMKDILSTCIATIRLFDRLGDREKMHRNRMRYLVHDMGFEKFQKLVLKERIIVNATKSITTKLEIIEEQVPSIAASIISYESTDNPLGYQKWLHTNVVQQKQQGYTVAFITLQAGDITSRQLKVLAEICREFSAEGCVRTTPAQNIVLRWVLQSDLLDLYQRLVQTGLANSGALTIASPVGCVGTTSCNLAITNSHRLAKEIQAKFTELGLDMDDELRDSTIKISGCPNSCGQHEIATMGFYGGASRVNNTLAPTYNMLLGGSTGEKSSLGKVFTRVPAKKIIDVVLKIIELYRQEKNEGEKLNEWIYRILRGEGSMNVKNSKDLKTIIDTVTPLPSPEQSPESYIDYGNDVQFLAKTARGECAA
ncbi:MAG: ferredoxin--nitrite reductase [Thaumarchaeota archaeon]|nr:ferredoxin--nitrite reductase [Nitrososphaerota archaeon]|tara:strand:- start:575 stop:2380 length:1806 start_codon:yes stop_codon:yes gene_type:complete